MSIDALIVAMLVIGFFAGVIAGPSLTKPRQISQWDRELPQGMSSALPISLCILVFLVLMTTLGAQAAVAPSSNTASEHRYWLRWGSGSLCGGEAPHSPRDEAGESRGARPAESRESGRAHGQPGKTGTNSAGLK